MSNALTVANSTEIAGYFNPNSWPVQVAISELNLTVTLQPMEFILDRAGRRINDPLLNRFVGPKMLSVEKSAQPVPVLRIPTVPLPKPDPHRHSVRQGVKNEKGKWQPAAPRPVDEPALPVVTTQPSSLASIKGMSIEEAKRRGYIGKQRILPEDYGLEESAGTPIRGERMPSIKHSFEAPAPMARPGALPRELVEEAQNNPLVQSMQQVAATTSPESVPKLNRTAVLAQVKAQQGAEGVRQLKAELARTAPAKTVAALPEPQLDSASPIMGGIPAALPPPQLDGPSELAVAETVASEPTERVCPACNKTFTYPSYLKRHIKRAHTTDAEALLAAVESG